VYNPEWGRFINADGLLGTQGELILFNMFAYYKNNPINSSDSTGYKEVVDSDGGRFAYGLALVFAGGSVVASYIEQKMVSVTKTFGT